MSGLILPPGVSTLVPFEGMLLIGNYKFSFKRMSTDEVAYRIEHTTQKAVEANVVTVERVLQRMQELFNTIPKKATKR
jgi:hypothetical protein